MEECSEDVALVEVDISKVIQAGARALRLTKQGCCDVLEKGASVPKYFSRSAECGELL